MRRTPVSLVAGLMICGCVLAQSGPGAVRQFTVDDAWGRDAVQFQTTAPMEDIIGTANQGTGVLKADPANLTGPGTAARIEAAAASFKTAIDMRDSAVAKPPGPPTNPVSGFT